MDLNIALIKKEIDRFIFPNYKDLLMYLRMDEYQAEGSLYKIAKVFDSPFQIGMVLARSPGYLGDDDRVFLRCLRTTLTQGDKAVNLPCLRFRSSSRFRFHFRFYSRSRFRCHPRFHSRSRLSSRSRFLFRSRSHFRALSPSIPVLALAKISHAISNMKLIFKWECCFS